MPRWSNNAPYVIRRDMLCDRDVEFDLSGAILETDGASSLESCKE